MRKILLLLFILTSNTVFSAYGVYKAKKIESDIAISIPGRPKLEKWNYLILYDDKNKPFLKIYSKLVVYKESADFYTYIINLTTTTIRFYLILEMKYILKKAFKIILAKNGKTGPAKRVIQLGGNFHSIDWGVAVYKKWINNKNYSGRGEIEHW